MSQQVPALDSSTTLECLGLTFENEGQRRAYFVEKLREKLLEPDFRQTAGFPPGSPEDILALSDPPYYTACPNPFLPDFVEYYRTSPKEPPAKEPYTQALRSSSRHPVYSFHPYHTKVPPEVIRRLIEHYSRSGELVLDSFSGSGMTGVAAREAGRNAILLDLSPVAGFIGAVNCRSHDWRKALELLKEIIAASEEKWDHVYQTEENCKKLTVNYYVWSDVFSCPACAHEFPFFLHGVVHYGHKVETRKAFPCPVCGTELNIRRVERVLNRYGKKKALVWVNAGSRRQRINRPPNKADLELAAELEAKLPENWYPQDKINPDGYSAKLAQLGDKAINDVSRFLSRRNLLVFADLWERVGKLEDVALRNLARATLTSIFTVISERQGYFGGGGGMSGNLYMPVIRTEKNIYEVLRRKLARLEEAEQSKANLSGQVIISTQSATRLETIPDASIDYVYTDPPFGANIIYSEMNLILEAWLRLKTNNEAEAVIDSARQRNFEMYAALLTTCFKEYFRVLKPGRWMTVEFHNTLAEVWNLVQQAIGESGFVVAGIDVIDKGSTTILGDIRPGSAKHDLLISVYKPASVLNGEFKLQTGPEQVVWDFVQDYLEKLPVSNERALSFERTAHVLFNRMVAYHVQRGYNVPLSAPQFYEGLNRRFCQQNGQYFLAEQIPNP